MLNLRLALFFALIFSVSAAFAQTQPDKLDKPDKQDNPYYSRRNTFGIFTAYSNDSSHILLGLAENRKLLNFGASYSRRLFQNRIVNWQYNAEILPVALESDPTIHETITFTSPIAMTSQSTGVPVYACHADSGNFSQTINGVLYAYSYVNTCSRRWTIGEGMSPVGFQWNFLPRNKMQPFVIAHGGYMYSTQPIPDVYAGNFNFTFDFGVGVEIYQSKSRTGTRSVRAEYRYHHISNRDTATDNPGIDNGLFQVTYAFGR